ncbi:monovalent cation/H+ antiporter complex subunit F [Methanobrevibacter sp. DSM 116169]|uniref:monovalent cation/H+ antiporter complex subunit F n=1 Tax=Methanobrevibacter sp. DSM 116169 TaxID=3242727 RepID=UPI0038FC0FDC
MELIFFSQIILIIALIVLMLVVLRISAYSSTAMGLIGASVLTMIVALALVIFDKLHYIKFNFDIALALMLFGFVGTIVFSYVLGGYE